MNSIKKIYKYLKKFPSTLYHQDLEKVYNRFDGVILDNMVGDVEDVQEYLTNLRLNLRPKTKVLISYHNHLWEPILLLASKLGFRQRTGVQNWLTSEDVHNFLNLSGFEHISTNRRFFGITTITVATNKKQSEAKNKFSVSIIIPARNEAGNIPKIVSQIPKFGKSQEIIFVEGHSKDRTWEKIQFQADKYKNSKHIHIKSFKQKGLGKANAVKLGFKKAKGDILMIYDADMTVSAKDLKKFYEAMTLELGDFANGSRLVYPMEKQAMQTLNKIGNHFFSKVFSWTFGQKFKDTLCGTKAIFRKDFMKYYKDYEYYLNQDPFGDFALIFMAIKNNLKVIEIPVRYKERNYGSTNISRFRHGLMLFKMVFLAIKEFKI